MSTKAMEELKAIPHWVGHKNKVPMNPNSGSAAQSNNPKTWATASKAWQAKNRFGWDGIGYVFTIKAGIVGVDLDDCFIGNGRTIDDLKPWAKDVVLCLQSYTEFSPSGNGLHIYVKGEIEGSINKSKLGFEMYDELRYFTVTGKVLPGWMTEIRERHEELAALYVVFGDEMERPLPDVSSGRDYGVASKEEIKDALNHLPIWGDYHDWLKILMAVHDAYPGNDGVALIEAWSPGKKGEVTRKFRSFDKTSKSGITIATLFHMAKQGGWKPKQASNSWRYRKADGNANITTKLDMNGGNDGFRIAE